MDSRLHQIRRDGMPGSGDPTVQRADRTIRRDYLGFEKRRREELRYGSMAVPADGSTRNDRLGFAEEQERLAVTEWQCGSGRGEWGDYVEHIVDVVATKVPGIGWTVEGAVEMKVTEEQLGCCVGTTKCLR
jgi:hypothetical protein